MEPRRALFWTAAVIVTCFALAGTVLAAPGLMLAAPAVFFVPARLLRRPPRFTDADFTQLTGGPA